MKQIRLIWQIYIPIVLVMVASVLVFTWYVSNSFSSFYLEQKEADLTLRAQLIREQISHLYLSDDLVRLDRLCKQIGNDSATRITIIAPSGKVVVDSEEDSAVMDNHASRAEIITALGGEPGSSIRFSQTLGRDMLYVAVPVFDLRSVSQEDFVRGILRLSISVATIDQAIGAIHLKVILGSLALILIAAVIILTVSRMVSRPLEEMRTVAERISEGNFERTFSFTRRKSISIEVAELATAMNKMALQLAERIGTITSQRNELKAVFSSMVEAVLVVDTSERLVSANSAAGKFLHMSSPDIEGLPIDKAIKNIDLIRFIRTAMAQEEPLENEIIARDGSGDLLLHVHGTPLKDPAANIVGSLIVLNDVTRLRKLENIRKDFVANVSHELRTPITTIKGFVETLRDGALDNRQEAERFIGIILKNADRLNAIVEDLLTLSRVEQEDEQGEIELQTEKIQLLLQNVIEACAMQAQEKEITLRLECDAGLTARINGPLLEQAVVNLVNNAIKYSSENSYVEIKAIPHDNQVAIQVEDYGPGIAADHLPRLFERFYRSDKARSRKLGGTGLGLAIVKHIVQAHNGHVRVDSTLNEGTIFTIELPSR